MKRAYEECIIRYEYIDEIVLTPETGTINKSPLHMRFADTEIQNTYTELQVQGIGEELT